MKKARVESLWLFFLTARSAVLFQSCFPDSCCDPKADNSNCKEQYDLIDRQLSAQSLEGNCRCHCDGNDEGDDNPQPGRIDCGRITPRIKQSLQDGDVVVELGKPKGEGD